VKMKRWLAYVKQVSWGGELPILQASGVVI
jgi:hypothetical protein